MTELEGRELDAAIARGLGWEVQGEKYNLFPGTGRYIWVDLPKFHRSTDAIWEHCGPRMHEHGWSISLKWLKSGDVLAIVNNGERRFVTLDSPDLALARAVLAAMEAKRAAK